VARAANVTLEQVRELNTFLLRGLTPPDRPVYVRVPLGAAGAADSLLRIMPDSERTALHAHKVRKGETLARIASANGMSAKQLAWYNPRIKSGRKGALPVGQVVQVPTTDVLAGAFDVPDPAIEKYGTSRASRTHRVRRGESLGSIAQRYRTSVTTLVRLNHLKKRVIYPGQTIIVSAASRGTTVRRSSAKTAAKPTAASKRSSAKTGASKATPQPKSSASTPAAKQKAASAKKAASTKTP
jgi:LysM repeat protein